MLGNSPVLVGLSFVYIVVISMFNLFGAYIVQVADAMIRMLLDPMRTVVIWIIGIFTWYVLTDGKAGESLSYWSILELVGFLLLCLGIFTNNGMIKYPCFKYEQKEDPKKKKTEEEKSKEEASVSLLTPPTEDCKESNDSNEPVQLKEEETNSS